MIRIFHEITAPWIRGNGLKYFTFCNSYAKIKENRNSKRLKFLLCFKNVQNMQFILRFTTCKKFKKNNIITSFYDGLSKTKQRVLEQTLNEAVREAVDDETFRKVKRSSYGKRGPEVVHS